MLLDCRVFHDANFVKKHPKRCCQHITKLLCLFTRGETFSSTEISDVFFGVTKLFQSPDVQTNTTCSALPRSMSRRSHNRCYLSMIALVQGNLRRMVYLFLKEVAESTASDEVPSPDTKTTQPLQPVLRPHPSCHCVPSIPPFLQIIIITSSLFKDMNHNTDLYRANSLRVLAKIMDVRGFVFELESQWSFVLYAVCSLPFLCCIPSPRHLAPWIATSSKPL